MEEVTVMFHCSKVIVLLKDIILKQYCIVGSLRNTTHTVLTPLHDNFIWDTDNTTRPLNSHN